MYCEADRLRSEGISIAYVDDGIRAWGGETRDVLKNVVDSLEAFYRRLVANNVAVGFEVTVPAELNTNETISEGKIYIKHRVQEMPLIKNITNRIYRVTDYSQVLIEEL